MWSSSVICSASSMAERDSKHSALGLSAWEYTHLYSLCFNMHRNDSVKKDTAPHKHKSTSHTGKPSLTGLWQNSPHYTETTTWFLPRWSGAGDSFSVPQPGDKWFKSPLQGLRFVLWVTYWILTICNMSSIFSWASSCSSWERPLKRKTHTVTTCAPTACTFTSGT